MNINKPATIEDIQDLINWLAVQTGSYDANDPYQCAIAQYLRDRGHERIRFDGTKELHADGNHIVLPDIIGEIVYGTDHVVGSSNKQQFSAAFVRARSVHTEMLYAIKPTEDPGAAALELRIAGGFGLQDETSTLIEHPDQVDDPDLPTDDTN